MNLIEIRKALNNLSLLATRSGQVMAINSEDVAQIIFGRYIIDGYDENEKPIFKEVIIYVFKNGTSEEFDATPENKGEAQLVLDKLSAKKIKP